MFTLKGYAVQCFNSSNKWIHFCTTIQTDLLAYEFLRRSKSTLQYKSKQPHAPLRSHEFGSTFIPKPFLRCPWLFRWTAVRFRRIQAFLQLFRFGFIPGNSGIQQNSMLTGRWREGRILINLCGKNNVQNCDLLQRASFARCRTVLGVAKGFFWCV